MDKTTTAWMLRRDGIAFPCQWHYYGNADPADVEETLYAAEWLYDATQSEETRQLCLELMAAYGVALRPNRNLVRNLLRVIRERPYVFLSRAFVERHAGALFYVDPARLPGLNAAVNRALNGEFLRVRLGGICCKILDVLDELRDKIGSGLYYALDPAPKIAEAQTLADLTSALDEIFDAICRAQNAESQEPKPQWVDKMSAYILGHYTDEALGLTEVSSVFGITPSYATRVFKQYTGRGIYETIQHVRLTAAKSMMHSDKTMKEIAHAVGYTSFLSMNRAFKKYEGATPSQFKGH